MRTSKVNSQLVPNAFTPPPLSSHCLPGYANGANLYKFVIWLLPSQRKVDPGKNARNKAQ